jgi:hypothetical protein
VPAASGDRPAATLTSGTLTAVSTFFAVCPLVSSAFLKKLKARNKLSHCPLNRLPMAVYLVGNGIHRKEEGRRKKEEGEKKKEAGKSLILGLIMLCIRAVGLYTKMYFMLN